jgi:hypothetical protein
MAVEIVHFISKKYNIGKFNRICNHHDCPKFPSKEILIMEVEKKGDKKKDMASLFFCHGHFREAHKELQKELEQFDTHSKKLEMKTFEIGYITY